MKHAPLVAIMLVMMVVGGGWPTRAYWTQPVGTAYTPAVHPILPYSQRAPEQADTNRPTDTDRSGFSEATLTAEALEPSSCRWGVNCLFFQ